MRRRPLLCLLLCLPCLGQAQRHAMTMDDSGMVMNQNHHGLPRGCERISRDYAFAIRAGTAYAADAPGMVFGMSRHELRVAPCARLTVTFVNEDQVRHQWMVHGLPAYLYAQGMFHIEASAGARQTGTFIVPADDRTYLIHCDMAQHMENGMKGQLVVGAGSGDLWSVKGIGRPFTTDSYLPEPGRWLLLAAAMAGLGLSLRAVRR